MGCSGSVWERIYHASLHLQFSTAASALSVLPHLPQNLPAFAECAHGRMAVAAASAPITPREAHITCHSSHSCSRIVSLPCSLPGLVATEMISVPPRALQYFLPSENNLNASVAAVFLLMTGILSLESPSSASLRPSH